MGFDASYIRRLEDHNVETWRFLTSLLPGCMEIDSGLAVFWPEVASPLFNRVLGVGRDGSVDMAGLDRAIERYRANGAPWSIQLPPDLTDHTVRAALTERGMKLHETQPALSLVADNWIRPEIAGSASVEVVDDPSSGDFAGILVRSFELPELIGDWIIAMSRLPSITNFLGRIDGQPAGTGMLSEVAGVAGLYSGGTLEQFRRRGLHTALIAARVSAAFDRGHDLIYCETESEGNQSFRDLERQGFRLAFAREHWAPKG